MADYVIPTIGSSGFFNLKAPFTINNNERYTCKAIRKISDYVANNDDLYNDVYVPNGLTQDNYETDQKKDVDIISLQSEKGHWIFVPANYILTLPITNGIPYRQMALHLALPAMPVTQDLTTLSTEIRDMVIERLGVTPAYKWVETSKVALISSERHDMQQVKRNTAKTSTVTDRAKYTTLLANHNEALKKIRELELYIKTHFVGH